VAGVYLSYPFCAQKCTFCNFASGVFPPELERTYVAAVASELAEMRWPWTPETVYLGGGTPGGMAADDLRRWLALIPGAPWAEATLEAAPGAISAQQAAAWRAAGINRVSLGVQSFVASELRQTGRKHTAAGVAADVAALRAAGIGAINIDLIAGLPYQTAASWQESLGWIERLEPQHVSVYMLEVDEDSRLGAEMLRGGLRFAAAQAPDEDAVADLYLGAVDRLAAFGLPRYEISNFARPGHESRHNLKYWRREPYLGFGADAHSFDGTLRWQNAETAVDYVAGGRRIEVTEAHAEEERWFVGLRLMEGVALQPDDRERIAPLVAAGLLEESAGRVRLTARGVLLSNEVFREFIGND
jgi:oxygen-independent coproporphyrinogen-3 oxidase